MNLYQFNRTPRDKVLGICKCECQIFSSDRTHSMNAAGNVSQITCLAHDLSDSHPLFRRGYEDLCNRIKRPSKKGHLSATMSANKLQGIEIILSDIVPIDDSSSGNTDREPVNRRPVSLDGSFSNLETSRVHSITNEDLTATEKITSKSTKSRSQPSNDHLEQQGKQKTNVMYRLQRRYEKVLTLCFYHSNFQDLAMVFLRVRSSPIAS